MASADQSEDDDDYPQKVKVVLVGEKDVGKTCISVRFCKDHFDKQTKTTIGAAFLSKRVTVGQQSVFLNVWDTGGEERYHCLAPIYYRGSQAAIVVYEITSMESFRTAQGWIDEIRQNANPLIILAGNKVDLQHKREVPLEDAKQFAAENKLILFETSAKDNVHIEDMFRIIAREALKSVPSPKEPSKVNLNSPSTKPKKGCC